MATRFCVFCGERPESKNREHVIPSWLIEMTGDPKREVNLGLDLTAQAPRQRRFAFDQFVFPACEGCNSAFSELEARARSVVVEILERRPLTASDWDTFLDWLDKVRIGLWLAGILLNKNYQGIEPSFHIDRRVGSADRMVVIYEAEPDGWQGVVWAGTETPAFHAMPSCFALTINGFCFVNISREFLLAERMGLPHPSGRWLDDEFRHHITLAPGTRRLQLPLFPYPFRSGGRTLLQPAIPWDAVKVDDAADDPYDLYRDPWTRGLFRDFDAGQGNIYRPTKDGLIQYRDAASNDWVPPYRRPRLESAWACTLATYEILGSLYNDAPSLDRMEPDARNRAESFMRVNGEAHDEMTKLLVSMKREWLKGPSSQPGIEADSASARMM